MIFGDFIFALDLDRPVRASMSSKRWRASICPMRASCRSVFLSHRKKQDRAPEPKYPEYYDDADIIAGDFHFMRQYMPDRLDGKMVLTNTLTAGDVEELRSRGVTMLVTTTPDFAGRSFGTNASRRRYSRCWERRGRSDGADYAACSPNCSCVARREPGRAVNLWRRLVATQPYDRLSPRTRAAAFRCGACWRRGLDRRGLGTMLGGIFSTIGSARKRGRRRRAGIVRADRHRVRVRRTLLRRTRRDGADCRQRLYVCLRHARRVCGLDHRLGSDPRVRISVAP